MNLSGWGNPNISAIKCKVAPWNTDNQLKTRTYSRIQHVLEEPGWSERMTARDLAALSPLIYLHSNPYGRFELDMEARLALAQDLPMSENSGYAAGAQI